MKLKFTLLFIGAIIAINLFLKQGTIKNTDDQLFFSLKMLEAMADDESEQDPPPDPGEDPTPYLPSPFDLDSMYYERYANPIY